MPLEVVRNTFPEGLRRRLPAVILLIAAFYLGLSAMFAIPVLQSGANLGLSSAAITEDLLQPPTEIIVRLKLLNADLQAMKSGEDPTRGVNPDGPVTQRVMPESERNRGQTTQIYVGIYERQREYLRVLLEGAEVRLRQLAAETRSRASSSPRAFLGRRDKDRFVATVTDYYQSTICRNTKSVSTIVAIR